VINVYKEMDESHTNQDDGGTMKKIIALTLFVLLPLTAYAGKRRKRKNRRSATSNQREAPWWRTVAGAN